MHPKRHTHKDTTELPDVERTYHNDGDDPGEPHAVLADAELIRADDGARIRLCRLADGGFEALIGAERGAPTTERVGADTIADRIATQEWRVPGWGETPLRVRRALEALTNRELVDDGAREVRTDGGEWRVRQTGLDERGARGQTTLDGDIRREEGDDDE